MWSNHSTFVESSLAIDTFNKPWPGGVRYNPSSTASYIMECKITLLWCDVVFNVWILFVFVFVFVGVFVSLIIIGAVSVELSIWNGLDTAVLVADFDFVVF